MFADTVVWSILRGPYQQDGSSGAGQPWQQLVLCHTHPDDRQNAAEFAQLVWNKNTGKISQQLFRFIHVDVSFRKFRSRIAVICKKNCIFL